jgi:serine/threonine protein kinase
VSEPKLISPLLDGCVIGDPISDHHGVRCCPAMQTESESKYIVKIISLPASQVKLDALLLAGAFSSVDAAKVYFQDLAEGVVEEAAALQQLSRLEGFLPYESWQVVPMEDGETGYDVYLKGPYRSTLERRLRKGAMTHLAAVNLGLDLCAALTVCRRAGYLYADLKPSNICICDEKEYRIADLGFISLDSLNYASLPERYLSEYTAPEITDAYSALNTTMDVYAAGLILYQIFNGGTLPFEGRAPAQELSAPAYADGEMAQIILKAVALEPDARWKDPLQMGQALVAYLQRNNVNDTPIGPVEEPAPEFLAEEPVEETPVVEEPSTEDILAEVDDALIAAGMDEEDLIVEEASVEEETPAEEEVPAEEEAPAEEVTPADFAE